MKCFYSLYGCTIWSLSSSSMNVALNKILPKVWNLPCHANPTTAHCVAQVPTIISAFVHYIPALYLHLLSWSVPSVLTLLHIHTVSLYVWSSTSNDEDYNIGTIQLFH